MEQQKRGSFCLWNPGEVSFVPDRFSYKLVVSLDSFDSCDATFDRDILLLSYQLHTVSLTVVEDS